ncbi:MAG: hypothetical protein OXG05_14170 [Gammaproteobacteria bacterium]|nr:hypothetical protein [Gammaproteobacteria bacterium]
MSSEIWSKRATGSSLHIVSVYPPPLHYIDVTSENQRMRVDYLIFHFATEYFENSLRLLTERTERPVSSHYLVPENGDPSDPHSRSKVYRLVEKDHRA